MLFKDPTETAGAKMLLRSFACAVVFILCASGLKFATGVITELNFNEGSGTNAADFSGNAHNGSLVNGPVWTAGKYGQAVSFDGSNDYVNLADHTDYTLTPTQSYTWSGWIRNNNFNQWSTIWSQSLNTSSYFYFYAHSTTDAEAGPVTNGLSVFWYNGSSRLVIHSNNNVLSTGTWAYVAITYNASQTQASRFTIYVNGTDVTDRTDVVSSGTIAAIDPTNIRMGSNEPFGEYYNGAIDEMRYYRRLLSTSEIQSDMNINSTLDATAPAVSLTAPSAGTVSGTVNVTANATDNIAVTGVQFLVNGANLGTEDLNAPYSASWNTTAIANGTYTLTARARDAAGNTTTSSSVVVTVNNDTQAPAVSITAPAAGTVSGTINVNATATDNVGVIGVQFLLDGVNLGTEDLAAPYSVSWNTTTATNGSHTLTARARDAAGNTTTSSNVVVTVTNDSQAPIVSISSPAAGTVNGTLNVNATATDNIGVIGVQFLLDGVNLSTEDLAAPYSVSWNTTTATNGSHTLTARARDAVGNTTTSTSVVVTVNNDIQAPAVSISSPAAGTVNGTLNVNATATDNVGVVGVQFLLDGANLGTEDLAAPYSVSWNTNTATNGSHTLTARARDAAGNTTTASNVVVTVTNDSQAPVVSISSPAAGTVNGTLNVNATATDNIGVVGVQFLLDGVNLGTEDLTAPYSVSWNTTTATNGSHTLTARARDAAGNTTTSSNVVVTVTNDSQAPVVSISSPAAGTVSGTLNVNATATDNVGVVGVQFLLDGANLGTEDLAAPYSVSWNTTTATNGSHTLTARARDAAGNITTSSSVVVTVNNDIQAPAVSISGPAAGTVNGTINVNATATDNVGVVGVQFLLDGANLDIEDLAAPYSVSWNTITTTNGSHTLTARARDAAGNITTSATVIVNVSNPDVTKPTVAITAPAAGNVTGTVSVTATAADNIGVVGVQFLLDGTNLGTEDLSSPYSISWTTTTAANGAHVLTAIARDAAGNTTVSTAVNVTVNNDTQAPSVIVLPPSGQNVFGTVTLEATASDNTAVVGVQFLLDGVNLGAEDLTAPYSVSWNTTTTANGSHILTARARDAAGNIATSPTTIVLVSNAPGVANRLTALPFDEGSGTNAADISGNNHNGTLSSATWTAGKYGQSVNLNGSSSYVNIADHADYTLNPAQNYTWSAWVKNNNFNESGTVWSQTINASSFFYIYAHSSSDEDSGPVTNGVSVHWWVNGGSSKLSVHSNNNVLTAGQWSHIAVTYNASQAQNNRFTIYVNGVDVTARTDVSSAGTISTIDATNIRVGSNEPFGEYLNGAVDEVRYYNRLLTGTEITADMNAPLGTDNTAPTVNMTAPANNATVVGTINVTANASDNTAVVGVQFLLDGVALGAEDLAAPYTISWNTTTASSGNHTLSAVARDAAGNIATSTAVTVNVNNDSQAPTVTVAAPQTSPVSGNINLTATAADNIGVVGVQFLVDGVASGAEDLTAPYTIVWNTATASNGSHSITARARDAAGNIKVSTAVTFTVNNVQDTQSPAVTIASPISGNVSGTINITANASDNIGVVGVQFLVDGVNQGTEDMAAPYTISWNTITIANGSHTLTARARDAAGNTTRSSPATIIIRNDPDVKPPTVALTAPATGVTVGGIVTISANAADNIGVAAVQFMLDGVNLGTQDTTAPYSISWNTGFSTTGTHTLSAKARDAAGNTTTSASISVNVIMTDPPVISGITVTSITAGSAVINWTTNVPTNAQVVYGATTSYGLSTLIDQALATTHSMQLSGLAPGTLHHFQVLSADANATLTSSADLTFTTTNLSSNLGTLNGHSVLAEGGKILSWTPNPIDGYHTVITLAWNYMINGVPNDPSTGKPAYYSRSYIDPNTQAMVAWPHNPAGLYAQLAESAQKYYQYSGNTAVMTIAENVALWQIDHGMTLSTDSWPLVPYASGDAGSLTYAGAVYGNGNGQGDGVGYIQPDKVGELGFAWLQLYKYDGNLRFKDAAIQAANVLSSKIRPGTVSQSPWPYRVNARTGVVREDYCSHIIAPIALLDDMIASGIGDTAAYRTARTIAWNWMMTYPMVNNAWAQYFEDVPIQPAYNTNINQYNAMMVARYLMEHPEFDPNWEAHVRGLISWVETKFGQTNLTALTIKEQDPIFPYAMGSHTARYASVNAMLYEKTGDLAAKEKAFRSFNWATYMTKNNGVVIDGPNVDHEWFTDGYGDYIRHFVVGMASVPEWSPANQTHMLRSNSVVKSITYGTNSVNYTTAEGTSKEVLHLNFTPGTVTADGVVLQKRTDGNQPGWTIDVATKTIRIYHVNATQISITAGSGNQVVRR